MTVQTSEQGRNKGQSFDDPLKIQTSDNPAMALVTALLTEMNYLTWSRSVRQALAAKNKLGFISGTMPEPSGEPEKSAWRRANEMVSSWITKFHFEGDCGNFRLLHICERSLDIS